MASRMQAPERVGWERLGELVPGFDPDTGYVGIHLPPAHSYGQMSNQEIAILAEIVRCRNPERVFEFGRADGLTTLVLALAAPMATVFTLDLPDEQQDESDVDYGTKKPLRARKRWREKNVDDRIVEVLVNSREFSPGEYAHEGQSGYFADNPCKVVLIDANHDYEFVKMDTESALQMISSDGLIIWHDYYKRSFPGVTGFLAEFATAYKVYWIEDQGRQLDASGAGTATRPVETSLCFSFLQRP